MDTETEAAREQERELLLATQLELASTQQKLAERDQQLADVAATIELKALQKLADVEQQLADLAATIELQALLAIVSNPVLLKQDISSLTQRINAANIELNDEDYLASYLECDSPVDTSVTYAFGPPTSLTSTNDNSSIAMSTVRLGRVANRPKTYFWEIDELAASEQVCTVFFESDVERMQRFVHFYAAQITSLRRLLRYAEEQGRGATEASLQVFFLAFLKEFVAAAGWRGRGRRGQ